MIVLAAGPGDFTGRPRPFVVVQSDLFNETHASFSLCPLTSHAGGTPLFRIGFSPDPENGLVQECDAQVDKVQTLRRERIVRIVGVAGENRMEQIDDALRRWLEL